MGVVKDVIHAARSLKAQYELQVHHTHTKEKDTINRQLVVASCSVLSWGDLVKRPCQDQRSKPSALSNLPICLLSSFLCLWLCLCRVPRCSRCW
jgi:hypothetical protein